MSFRCIASCTTIWARRRWLVGAGVAAHDQPFYDDDEMEFDVDAEDEEEMEFNVDAEDAAHEALAEQPHPDQHLQVVHRAEQVLAALPPWPDVDIHVVATDGELTESEDEALLDAEHGGSEAASQTSSGALHVSMSTYSLCAHQSCVVLCSPFRADQSAARKALHAAALVDSPPEKASAV